MDSSAGAALPEPAEAPPSPEGAAPEQKAEEPSAEPLPAFRSSFWARYLKAPFWAGLLGGGVFFFCLALMLSFHTARMTGEPRLPAILLFAFAPAFGASLWLGYLGPVRSYAALFGRIVGALSFGAATSFCWVAVLVFIFQATRPSDKTAFTVIALGGAIFAALALYRLHGLGSSRPRRIGARVGASAVVLVSLWPTSAAFRCRAGFGEACAIAAEERFGWGDLAGAAFYGERGCDAEVAASCTLAGVVYQRSRATPQDLARAEALFRRGCAMDDEEASGRVHGIELMKRCDRFSAPACRELADAYARGHDVDQDSALAAQHYRKACLLGESVACGR